MLRCRAEALGDHNLDTGEPSVADTIHPGTERALGGLQKLARELHNRGPGPRSRARWHRSPSRSRRKLDVRIAVFTDTYPDDVNGVARTLGMLTAHAAYRGHEVALVTPTVSDLPAPVATHHRQLPGIPVPIYPDLQLARGVDRAGRRMLAGFRPELVHVATESTVGFSSRRWALRERVPLVTSFHTNFPAYLHD